MLTFFTVEKVKSTCFLPRRNRIIKEVKSGGGVTVKHIKLVSGFGKIPYGKIARHCGEESGRLLTEEGLELPEETGLRRFYCDELKVRLSLNMGVQLLKNMQDTAQGVETAFYDPQGRIADGAEAILKFTDRLTAVSRMTGIYAAEAQRILSESGAVLNISRRMKSVENAKLIIAPEKLKVRLPVSKNTVILTVAAPAVAQNCTVYYKYFFDLSKGLLSVLPSGFDREYFAEALYTLCGRYDLGSVIPTAAGGEGEPQSLEFITKYLAGVCR